MNRRTLYIALCIIVFCRLALIEARCITGPLSMTTISFGPANASLYEDIGFLTGSTFPVVLVYIRGGPGSLGGKLWAGKAQIKSRTGKSNGQSPKKVGLQDNDRAPAIRSTMLPNIIGIVEDLLSNILAVILGSLAAYTWRGMRQLKIRNAEKMKNPKSE